MRAFAESIFGFNVPVSKGEAVAFRLFELLLVVLATLFAWRWGLYLPRLEEVVLPPGIGNYLDLSVLFEGPWSVINAIAITGLLVVSFLRLHRAGYLGAILLLHLQYAARFSQGKMPHGQNGVGILLLVFAIGLLAFRPGAIQQRFTMAMAYMFMGISYTSAALCKLIATGWTWPDGRHLWLWVHEKSIDVFSQYGTLGVNAIQDVVLNHWWIATAFLTIGLLSELIAILMIFRRYRAVAVVLVLGLHIGISITMNILFLHTMVLMAGLLLYHYSNRLDTLLPAARLSSLHNLLYPRLAFPRQHRRSTPTRRPA